MNKTILALALSSLASPLFTPTTQATMFSLSFNKLSLSYFFSSFVQSTSSSCSINIHNSDFGFFLSTVINIETANHNIDNRDMTTTYTGGDDGDHMGWITCPSLNCFDTMFHDIINDKFAAGAIAYQGSTDGHIRGSSFVRITTKGASLAGALGTRPNRNNKGKSWVESCCFSYCKEENEKKNHAFSLESPVKVDVSLTSISHCGLQDGTSVCRLKSGGTKILVSTLNVTSSYVQNGGSGLIITSSTFPQGAELKQSTFLGNKGNVIEVGYDVRDTNYINYPIKMSQCNFVSNDCSSIRGAQKPIVSFINEYGSSFRHKLTISDTVFDKNINYDDILQFYGIGQIGDLTMSGCSGNNPFKTDIVNYPVTDSKYKQLSKPVLNSNQFLNTQACLIRDGNEDSNNPNDPSNQGKDPDSPKNKLNGGQIAGIAIGSVAGVTVVSVAAFFAIKKLRTPKVSATDPQINN